MESIEKLHELAADINGTEIIAHIDVGSRFVIHTEWLDSWHKAFDAACDEIEREIAERYMEYPVDADGVPVHVGDKMQYHGGEPFTVCAVAPGVIHTWAAVKLGERSTTYHYMPDQCTHYKPRTIEDVLQDAGVSVAAIEDVAAEIRELVEVDA